MGEKLNRQIEEQSEDAFLKFRKQCKSPSIFKTRVKVYDSDDNEVLSLENITVSLVEQFQWFEVAIIWEDAGYEHEEYRGLGLRGKYSTSYYLMESLTYSNQLKISSNDSEKIIVVDSK